MKDKLLILLAMYPIGILLGLLFYSLRFLNWIHPSSGIKILNQKRFPKKQGCMLIVANHPSLLEPVLIPLLFFKELVFKPFGTPWSVPDKKNFFDRWYWAWSKIRLVPINRESDSETRSAIKRIREILGAGGRVILHPEGGRTSSGKLFYKNENGHKLRVLKEGVSLIVSSETLIVPIWIDGAEKVLPNKPGKLYHCFPDFRKRVIMKIGKPFCIKKINRKETAQKIALALLELADEE